MKSGLRLILWQVLNCNESWAFVLLIPKGHWLPDIMGVVSYSLAYVSGQTASITKMSSFREGGREVFLVATDPITGKRYSENVGMAPTMSALITDKKWERHCRTISGN